MERNPRREKMLQFVGVIIALLSLAYNGVKDYQKGELKIPVIEQKKDLTRPVYPIQYCLMAYDPNLDKVFYQHENGQWYEYAPAQRRYSQTQAQPYQNQTQGQKALGVGYGTPGASGYNYGQSPQTASYPPRY